MCKLLLGLCLLILVLPDLSLTAAAPTQSSWPIERRCVAELTPPKDWTFPGSILMSGSYGIYAIQAAWSTPRVAVFLKSNWYEWILSPDGHWLVTTDQIEDNRGLTNDPTSVQVKGFKVYSTWNPKKTYTIPWQANYTFEAGTGNTKEYFDQSVRWWDNEHLVYVNQGSKGIWEDGSQLVLINPFNQQIASLPNNLEKATYLLLPNSIYSASPDHTRLVAHPLTSTYYELYDLNLDQPLTQNLENNIRWVAEVIWKPDSQAFVNLVRVGNGYSIMLYDRNGKVLDKLAEGGNAFFDYRSGGWSPTGDYLIFLREAGFLAGGDKIDELYLANLSERKIINTCLRVSRKSFAWSPDDRLLSFIGPGQKGATPFVKILDIKNWRAYTVAQHKGAIIGWRAEN